MGKINVLPFAVANLIAAGEVVDRPASVVKELMENSIDAGARRITVEIQNGGVTFLRVSDDGCGMEKDELPVAIRRHATSKIKDASDLDTIITLGFRGEALAATCAVSKVRIISKPHGAPNGAMLEVNAGDIVSLSERGASDGTTVIVEDLFRNVPARRKFLKKDVTEAMAVTSTVEKIAVSHPEIAVTLIVDGHVKVETAGDGNLKSAVWAVFGKDFASRLLPVNGEFEDVRVSGFIGRTDNVKANRSYENFFINHRYVRSKTAMAAIEQAYVSYLPQERFPACVLFLEIDPRRVDVNVHPAKLEVKFSNEKPVFEAIYYAVRSALEQNVTRPEVKLGAPGGQRMSDTAFPVSNGKNESVRNLQMRMTEVPGAKNTPAFDRVTAEEYRRKYMGEAPSAGRTETHAGASRRAASSVPSAGTGSGTNGTGKTSAPISGDLPKSPNVPVSGVPSQPLPLEEQLPEDAAARGLPPIPDDLTAEEYLAHLDENRQAYNIAYGIPEAGQSGTAESSQEELLRELEQARGAFYASEQVASPQAPAEPTPAAQATQAPDGEEARPASVPKRETAVEAQSAPVPERETAVEAQSAPEDGENAVPAYRIIGEAFHSYVLVETGEKLLVIDKHAAHERLIFERLKANMRATEIPSQMLMLPIEVMLMTDEVGLIEEYRSELESVGFSFRTSRNTVYADAIPDGIDPSGVGDMLTAIVGNIKSATGTAKLTRDIIFEKALYQASCKAAIKAGREYPAEHIEWLVAEMMKLPDITFCPHGRPVALELSKKNLDHQFERT